MKPSEPVLPPRLRPGARVGVVCPASAPDPRELEAGIAALEQAGYCAVPGRHAFDRLGYMAGTARSRGADLTAMLADPRIDAVFCARGGVGCQHVLDHIDWSAAGSPRVFLGYSDITILHAAIRRHLGWVTFHGPMVTALGKGLGPRSLASLWPLMTRADAHGRLDVGDAPVRTLAPGRARGRLAGGCLELLAAAVGTPEAPVFDGAIAVIEDVGIPVYRADRALAQLHRAGLLAVAAGFVVGELTGWRDQASGDPATPPDYLWRRWLRPLGVPVVTGFPVGHVTDPVAVPLGCAAELDADAGTLAVLEPAVM